MPRHPQSILVLLLAAGCSVDDLEIGSLEQEAFVLEDEKIAAPVQDFQGMFGHVVELEPGVMAVGAPMVSDVGEFAGAVYLYEWNAGWSLVQTLYPSGPMVDDAWFGATLAMQGDRLAVGAQDYLNDRWLVYLYERARGGWWETARVHAPDRTAHGATVPAVALDGDWLAVGSVYNGELHDKAGAVFMYARDQVATWRLTQRIYPTHTSDKYLGQRVALSGGRLLAAPHWDHAYMYRLEPSGLWVKEATLVHGPSGSWVRDLDLDGDVAMIGNNFSYLENGSLKKSEKVRVFKRINGAWNNFQSLAVGDGFGMSIDLEGMAAVVGGYLHVADGNLPGRAYRFAAATPTRTTWGLVDTLMPGDGAHLDHFGFGVGVSGSLAAVGAPGLDGTSYPSAGAVYLFDW